MATTATDTGPVAAAYIEGEVPGLVDEEEVSAEEAAFDRAWAAELALLEAKHMAEALAFFIQRQQEQAQEQEQEQEQENEKDKEREPCVFSDDLPPLVDAELLPFRFPCVDGSCLPAELLPRNKKLLV